MAIASAAARYPGGTGVAIAAGGSYSGTFIPEIWSGKLLEKFYDATVMAAIANTDYEGEFANQGDTVHIRQRPDITISDYSPDMELAVQRPNASTVPLSIDYAKYFNVILDDVYAIQQDLDQMNMWAQDASEALKITVDTGVLGTVMPGAADPANMGATAGRISGNVDLGVTTGPQVLVPRLPGVGQTDIIDYLVSLGQVLDEQNVPESGRWVVIPSWMAAMIKTSDLRDAAITGDATSIMRNGRLGMIDRFTLYLSNLLPSGVTGGLVAGETRIYAGHSLAVTFASQINKVDTMTSERTFGRLMRGLQVYGAKVVNPIGLAEGVVKKG